MMWRSLISVIAVLAAAACSGQLNFGGRTQLPPLARTDAAPAWLAWRTGDFYKARTIAEDLIATGKAGDEARHVLALSQHMLGDFQVAINTYGEIKSDYRYLASLDEPILWSYVHLGDFKGARSFAEKRGLLRDKTIRNQLDLHVGRPMRVQAEGLSVLPFSKDRLSEYMPGFDIKLNGHKAVARLDTGGAWVVISPELAEIYGVKTVACERGFAGLVHGKVCYGIADLDIGNARFANVPVEVASVLSSSRKTFAKEFGVDFGPIIGTNVLRQFLATIDAPGQRLILSKLGDDSARQDHLALLPPLKKGLSFGIWEKHLMIAKGQYGDDRDHAMFIDSGLVMATPKEGQVALMVPQSLADSWQLIPESKGSLASLTNKFALGMPVLENLYAFIVPDSTWRHLGDWGGVNVEGMVSYGYLKHYIWTLDFEQRVFWLSNP